MPMQDEVEGQSQPDAGTVLYDLDLTNAHLHSLDEVSLPNTMRVGGVMGLEIGTWQPQPSNFSVGLSSPLAHAMQVLDATANRLKSIEAALLRLDGLTKLCLRQNLLTSAEEVEALASAPCEFVGWRVQAFSDLWNTMQGLVETCRSKINAHLCRLGGVGYPGQPIHTGRGLLGVGSSGLNWSVP